MAKHRKHHTSRHLMKNDTVMAYLKRVAHYETMENMRAHVFSLTGWDVDERVIEKIQGGKGHKLPKVNNNVIAQRVLWDRILMLEKQGMKREDIMGALGISKHKMTILERLHRHKIVSAKIKRSYFKAKAKEKDSNN